MRIVLISCVSQKKDRPLMASELYDSTWYKFAYKYALNSNADKIFILSAKYGLVRCEQIIEPYNVTLRDMDKKQRKKWSEKVIESLRLECDLERDFFCILAGENYREFLLPQIKYYSIPLLHLGIGKQISFLKNNYRFAESVCTCEELHLLCERAKHFTYPFDSEAIPKNGIYIMYENNEYGHVGNRIVRIGTHTGQDQLRSRLRQHFDLKNKDRSIFRKNLGRAMLMSMDSGYLEIWNLDNTSKKNRLGSVEMINHDLEYYLECKITDYIQKNFSFVILEESDKDRRLELESKIISTVSRCSKCGPSLSWIGNESPVEKIRESGLWQVNELYKTPVTKDDLYYILEHLVYC